MRDTEPRDALLGSLGTFGADLAKWPQAQARAAREALLGRPEFRRAWERERDLDRAVREHREALDAGIAASGALGRVRSRTLARLPAPPAGLRWQRIAAAVLVAGMLGGMLDVFLTERATATADIVMLDPLYGLEELEIQ